MPSDPFPTEQDSCSGVTKLGPTDPLAAPVRKHADDGNLRLLYLTPEMLRHDPAIFHRYGVRRIVFDEAHCLLSWGSTFRPDYLALAGRARAPDGVATLPASRSWLARPPSTARPGGDPEELGIEDALPIRGVFDRPNIYWGVTFPCVEWGARERELQARVLLTLPLDSQAIVYATYTRTCDGLASGLCRNGFRAAAYHGRLTATQREVIQERFSNGADDLQVMVATKAFGMGVDNRHVSLVVHYNHPENLAEYYQQAGRAGRRGQRAMALTLYSQEDRTQHEFLQSTSILDPEWLGRVIGRSQLGRQVAHRRRTPRTPGTDAYLGGTVSYDNISSSWPGRGCYWCATCPVTSA